MKTNITLINLRIELTEITLKEMQGRISDFSRMTALKHSYNMLKPLYMANK